MGPLVPSVSALECFCPWILRPRGFIVACILLLLAHNDPRVISGCLDSCTRQSTTLQMYIPINLRPLPGVYFCRGAYFCPTNACICLHQFLKIDIFLKESKVTWQLAKKQSIANALHDHRSFDSHCDKD